MEELKTLKDIHPDANKTIQELKVEGSGIISILKLKEEAVKWIKAKTSYCKCGLPLVRDYEGTLGCSSYEDEGQLEAKHTHIEGNAGDLDVIEFIKHFFNIKEDELK